MGKDSFEVHESVEVEKRQGNRKIPNSTPVMNRKMKKPTSGNSAKEKQKKVVGKNSRESSREKSGKRKVSATRQQLLYQSNPFGVLSVLTEST